MSRFLQSMLCYVLYLVHSESYNPMYVYIGESSPEVDVM